MSIRGQQFMRIIVFFDLPVKSKQERRRYTKFRKFLLKDGYDMLQYSIYCRLCNGMENIQQHTNRLAQEIPPKGSIRSLILTDKQFCRMKLWIGEPTIREKKVKPQQLILL